MPLSILEAINLTFNCFCNKESTKKKEENTNYDEMIFSTARKYDIGVLPVNSNIQIKNLYPITDQVHLWNTFIVGKDKTYILTSVNDFPGYREESTLLNKKGDSVLPKFLQDFFDPIWDKTLSSKQLQFYMIYHSRTYFVNTYPFVNEEKQVIGAIMFIRAFERMPFEKPDDMNTFLDTIPQNVKGRLSVDLK